jgi:F-type H+-transporting ATPase subunit alpha
VRAFEDGLLSLLRSKHADLLDTVRSSKDLSSDSEAKLKDVVQNFAKSFS